MPLEVTAEQLEALNSDVEVNHIAADAIVEASMAVSTTAIGADQLWSGLDGIGSTTGQGVGIAIVDSGIGAHPDLEGRVVKSVDFTDSSADGSDLYGHGTHVAGIAAGSPNGSGGPAGVAPGAHLINLRGAQRRGVGTRERSDRSYRLGDRQQGSVRHSRAESVARRASH